MRNVRMALVAGVMLAVVSGITWGQGVLIPTDTNLPPLGLKYLRVSTVIEDQAATTHVEQEFINSTSQPLECTYIFPLPKGAAVRDFAMYIGGVRVKGELVEKDKARQVYEDIVRRMRDPGLLEYMGTDLLKMRVFPVPARGTQKVEVEYTELTPMDAGLGEYVFPLKTGSKSSRTLEDFTMSVRIKSSTALKSVYSPSHEVGVSKVNDHEAVAGMEKKAAALDEDFRLFWTVSEKDFGLNLMTYRPDPDKPGMFLMLLSPKTEIEKTERVARDVVFMLDISGSMKGEKLDQAKVALKQCIEAARSEDRFAIIPFSTIAQSYAEGWTPATAEEKKKAYEWLAGQEASGGTNINDALELALGLPTDAKRPVTVMFLTDGQPTVNVTDIGKLAQLVKERNTKGVRFFTFGVGVDVNTHLLDQIANDTGGLPEYVRPAENIETKVTRLFSKMTHPVLTGLKIEVPGVKVADIYPTDLPDLFVGSQVVIAGSYEKRGPTAIRLTGYVGDKKREFVYEGTFPEKSVERSFISSIYAQRKIGFLLDQIRLHGENPELKNEVIRLSVLYGIQTPYTSYLVLENKAQYEKYGVALGGALRDGDSAGRSADARARDEKRRDALEQTVAPMAEKAATREAESAPTPRGKMAGVETNAEGLRTETGRKAVDVAEAVKKMKESGQAAGEASARRAVQLRGGRTLTNYMGVWVDEAYQGTEKLTKVKWGSAAYFRLVREHDDLRQVFALGEQVLVVTAKGQAVLVSTDEGSENLDDAQMKELFTDK